MAQTDNMGGALMRAPDGRLYRLDPEIRSTVVVEESAGDTPSWGSVRGTNQVVADAGASTFHIDPGMDTEASTFHIDPGMDAEASTFHIDPGVDVEASTFHIDPGPIGTSNIQTAR